MTAVETTSGFALPLGTLEDARALIGLRTAPRPATAPVSWGRIQQFCAMVQDGNATYWDEGFAKRYWGGVVGPPAMLMAWFTPLEWSPRSEAPEPMLMARIPLPGTSMINGSNDTTFHLPVRVGDRLTVEEELLSVSELKSTRLGDGHFVETLAIFRREDGVLVAEQKNTLFRFTPRDPS